MKYYGNPLIVAFILTISIRPCNSYAHLNSESLKSVQGSASHPFQSPGPNDIRGPCPGLNTAANHGYLNRSGITTFNELIQMQQKLYNVGLDLAIFLATVGVALDGDIVTGKLSIGRNSSAVPGLLKTPGGLNTHNTFEGDTSLTRNDYYLANGNNYAFNGTLYKMMHKVAKQNGGLYNRATMATYRYQRYQESLRDNGNFVFLPQSILLFGAASFLYQLFPNGTDMLPTELAISSFFGAKSDGSGHWTSIPERIPANWVKRKTPYTLVDVSAEVLALYVKHPVLFGGNVGGKPNTFLPSLTKLPLSQRTVNGVLCFLYQAILSVVPSQVQPIVTDPAAILNFTISKLDPVLGIRFGCPSTSLNLK